MSYERVSREYEKYPSIESDVSLSFQQLYTVDSILGSQMFNGFKGRLLNIVESIGLPDKQETAVKRMIVDEIHELHESTWNMLYNWLVPKEDSNLNKAIIE